MNPRPIRYKFDTNFFFILLKFKNLIDTKMKDQRFITHFLKYKNFIKYKIESLKTNRMFLQIKKLNTQTCQFRN